MKSPRDRSMILVAILSAAGVVVAAGLTSGHAFSTLVRGAAVEPVPASYAADTLELPVDVELETQESAVDRSSDPLMVKAPQVASAVPLPGELSPVVVEQVKSEMTRLSALPDGVAERVQALADQVSDGAGKVVIIVYWDEASPEGPGWTHTRLPGEIGRASCRERVF